MTNAELEKRLENLEAEVASLKSKLEEKKINRKSLGGSKESGFSRTIRSMMKRCVWGANIVNRKG